MEHRIKITDNIVNQIMEEMRWCDWLRNDTVVNVVLDFPGGYAYTSFPAALLPWNKNKQPKKTK